jgi:hypothetical protein
MVQPRRVASRLRPALAAFLLVFSLVAATGGQAAAWSPAVRNAPLDQTVQAADALAQINTAEDAFNLLQRNFAHPLAPDKLLQGAWAGVAAEAALYKVPAPEPLTGLQGDTATDLPRFRVALFEYITHLQSPPHEFVPGYAAVRGMVTFVDEGHTYFLDPQRYKDFLSWTQGDVHYPGIGARMGEPGLTVQ